MTEYWQLYQELSNQATPNRTTIHHPLMSLLDASPRDSLDVVGMTVEVRADADGAGVIVDLSFEEELVLVFVMAIVVRGGNEIVWVVPDTVMVQG